jgi:hypothetical protein
MFRQWIAPSVRAVSANLHVQPTKVQQQADWQSCRPQVVETLRREDVVMFARGLDLNDDLSSDQAIGDIMADNDAAVMDRHRNLTFDLHAAEPPLMREHSRTPSQRIRSRAYWRPGRRSR